MRMISKYRITPKQFLVFVCIFVSLCLGVWIGFGAVITINFGFAILSFNLIVFIVFYAQKRKIQSLIQNATQEELEALAQSYKSKQEIADEEENEFWNEAESQNTNSPIQSAQKELRNWKILPTNEVNTESKTNLQGKSSFWQSFNTQNIKSGTKIFFYPLRLFVYGFLVFGVLILIQHQIFHSLAFFSGLAVANFLVVFALLANFSKANQ